jgi:acetyltransferase-like isoleucine patch superfamily enzyme
MEYEQANRLLVSFRHIYKACMGMIAYYIPFPSFLTATIHRLRGVKIKNIWRVYIAYHVLIDSVHPEVVEIEEDAWLTRDVKILAHFNPTPVLREIFGGKRVEGVKIGRGAFIGINSIVMPGVHIGEGVLVGPGSIVTQDVPDYTWVAGNPAKMIKPLRTLPPRMSDEKDDGEKEKPPCSSMP